MSPGADSDRVGPPPWGALGSTVWAALAIAAGVAALAGTYPFARHGLTGSYFRRADWIGDRVTRIDPVPSSIGSELALGPVVPHDFSASWAGALAVDRPGTYRPECTTHAWCRIVLQDQLVFDSRDRAARRDVTLVPGIYKFVLDASTTSGRLDVDAWWQRAGERARPLRSDVLFPREITLRESRRLANVARLQRGLLATAAGIALLLAIDWARGRRRIGWAILLAAVAVGLAVHGDWPSLVRGPSPEEWQWPYRAGPFDRSLFAALATGLALVAGVALASSAAARRRPRLIAAALFTASVVVGLGFQLALLDTEPGGWQQTLVDRGWSGLGFLRAAALTADTSVSALLARYPSVIPTLSLHATVHPPGATLMYRTLAWAARSAGAAHVDLSFAFGSAHVPGALPLAGVALAGGLVLAASAALTALPVSLAVWVLRRDPLHAAAVGLLWPFCPGPTIFSPSLVQLCTLLVALVFALLLYAQRGDRGRTPAALASGLIAGGSLFFSYGVAPMVAAAAAMCAYRIDEPDARTIYVRTLIVWMIGLAAGTFVPMVFGYPVIGTAMTALRLHKEFTLTRSAVTWLGFNLVDFAMFFGPVSLVVVLAQCLAIANGRRQQRWVNWRLTAIVCSAILLLDLSSTSRGEVGRLWTPFMPLLFVATWNSPPWPERRESILDARDGVLVGTLSMLCCVALRLHWFVGF